MAETTTYSVRCMRRQACEIRSICVFSTDCLVDGVGSYGIIGRTNGGDFIRNCDSAPGGQVTLAMRSHTLSIKKDTGQCVSIWPKERRGSRRQSKSRLRF